MADDGESKKASNGKGGFKNRETPILIAARNGIIEMVKRILQVSPMAILDKDSEDNNIVLLSVKNRHTKLYELLVKRNPLDESAFHAIDAKGNSVLHVAAILDDRIAFPLASLGMQWEIKWFKVYSSFSIGLILEKKKKKVSKRLRESCVSLLKQP